MTVSTQGLSVIRYSFDFTNLIINNLKKELEKDRILDILDS